VVTKDCDDGRKIPEAGCTPIELGVTREIHWELKQESPSGCEPKGLSERSLEAMGFELESESVRFTPQSEETFLVGRRAVRDSAITYEF
jgi:hypothetical protein